MPQHSKEPFWKQRSEGQLPALKSTSIIRELIFYDTETYVHMLEDKSFIFPFRLGFATYIHLDKDYKPAKRQDKELWKIQDFEDFILSKMRPKKTLYIFAHNQAFDIRVLELPQRLQALGFEVDLPVVNMRTFFWHIKSDKGNLVFVDTANYAVSTVENLGVDMGYPKLSVDFDTVTNKDLMTYCHRDVKIIEEFILNLIDFINVHELGSFKVTLASLALSAYRTKFMTRKPHIHVHENSLWLERKAYYGGRTEAWYIGVKTGEKFYAVDVNSMYPWAMTLDNLPIRLAAYTTRGSIDELRTLLPNFFVIAKVKLATLENVYPLKIRGKLMFPTGEFLTYLCSPELEYAIEHNDIKEVYDMSIYFRAPVFKDFVNYFYSLRLQYTAEHNSSWRFITKIFQNSLYGKFAQLEPHRDIIGTCEPDEFGVLHGFNSHKQYRYKEVKWLGSIYKEYKEGETRFSFPGLSAAITAHSRMQLYRYALISGKENVFYMDTDSLIINELGYKRLSNHIDQTQLGKLKLEAVSSRLIIYGAKDYRIVGKLARKGVKKTATRLSKNTFEQLQFQGFTAYLNTPGFSPPIAQTRKRTRRLYYDMGVILENGRVTPHVLSYQNGEHQFLTDSRFHPLRQD